ncbi:MAG: hypothetical protein LBC89_00845, partial [Bacteroidales bacterium]|nr:hypothetical protein [Bacteroidales bacterium]
SSSEDYFVQWKEMLNENNADFSLNNWLKKIEIGNKQGYINKRDIDRIINILSYRNAEAKFRVLIIWLPETFYHDIATRLLKTLEEPSEGTIFILISENMSNLAATILSRTQIFKIPRLEKQNIVDFLQKRYEFPLENCEEIAEQANGNLVTANTLAQKSDEFVENYKNFVEWMRNSYKFSLKDIVSFSEEMQKSGREQVKNFLNFCLNEFQNCLLLNNGNDNLVKISQEERQFLKNFAPFININNIEKISSEVEKAIYHIERNGNIQIIMFDLGLIISKAIKNDK